MKSINISGTNISVYAKGETKPNGHRVSGQMFVQVGPEMTDMDISINGSPAKLTVKRNEDNAPKANDNGNYGWRINTKVHTQDGHHYQCNLHVTPVKMSGTMPTNGTFKVQVTGDITEYTPGANKGKREAVLAKAVAPTTKATPAPVMVPSAGPQSELDRLLAKLMAS